MLRFPLELPANSDVGPPPAGGLVEKAPAPAVTPLPGRTRTTRAGTVTLRGAARDDVSAALRESVDPEFALPVFEESIRRLDAQAHAIQVQKAALLLAIAHAQGTTLPPASGDEGEDAPGPSARKRGRS